MSKNKLIERLMKCDLAYELGKPIINDLEYDILKEEAKKKYGNDSYFKTVGAKVKNTVNPEIKLPFTMGSLDKIHIDTLDEWVRGKGYLTGSEKIDGVSIICTWENHKPVFAALRGDGDIGHDITEKAKYFIPDINTDEKITLRGDGTLLGDTYKQFDYVNRRNGTAGLLNRKDYNPNDLKLIKPIFYEIVDAPYIPNEEYERFLFIKSLGVDAPDFILITLRDLPNIKEILIKFLSQSKKYKPYDVDGIVLAKNVSVRENVLFPKDKIAFKVNNKEVVVTVQDITWQPSRFGKVVPVINIEPVRVGGVTISNVSGFHAGYIINNNIGANAKLSLVRSGDVIPYITGIIKPGKLSIPKRCPSCDSLLKRIGDELICSSVYCSESGVKRAAYFLKTIGVKGYSEKSVVRLGFADVNDIVNMRSIERRVNYSTYYRYIKALQSAIKKIEPFKILAGFGIPGVGLKVAKEVCDKLNIINNDSFIIKLFEYDINIDVGEKTTENLKNNIKKYRELFNSLCRVGLKIDGGSNTPRSGALSNKVFVITGTLPLSRNRVIEVIETAGGSVSNTVTRKTDFLITNSFSSNSTKYKKAERLGVSIIDWNGFTRLLS